MKTVQAKQFNKIFQIGFNKCGTTSIHDLFLDSGLRSVHWDKGIVAQKIVYNMAHNKKMLDGIDQYDCYTDIEHMQSLSFPLIEHYESLDKDYPNSLFILNTRPIDNWIKSRLNHRQGLYLKEYKQASQIESDEEIVENWKTHWYNHHKQVLEYFENKKNFLFFDIEKEPEKIIEFLKKWGVEASKLPHSHKTQKQ